MSGIVALAGKDSAALKLSAAVVGAVEGSVASTIRQFCHPEN
jgi:hypothetical protein